VTRLLTIPGIGLLTATALVVSMSAGRRPPLQTGRIRGTMDAMGRRISGGAFGSGFNGQSFTFTKQ
jgi:hypothetical protein